MATTSTRSNTQDNLGFPWSWRKCSNPSRPLTAGACQTSTRRPWGCRSTTRCAAATRWSRALAIPYDTVASLAADGLGDADIIDLYPSVTRRRNPRGDRACRASSPGRAPDSMKVLLDEDVPQPWIRLVEHLLRGHEVRHVSQLEWSGKKDVPLISDAARRGFDAFVTQNIGQFNDPAECDAIKRSGMHHISYELPATGVRGLGLASACALRRHHSRRYRARDPRQAAHRQDHFARQESQALQPH